MLSKCITKFTPVPWEACRPEICPLTVVNGFITDFLFKLQLDGSLQLGTSFLITEPVSFF